MENEQDNEKQKRIQFDFSSARLDNLDDIVRKSGATTRAEAVRRALSIYDSLLDLLGDSNNVVEIKDQLGNVAFRIPLKLLLKI